MVDGYTVAEAGKRTGLSEETIRRRHEAGVLPAVAVGTRPLRLTSESVDALRSEQLDRLGAVEPSAARLSGPRAEVADEPLLRVEVERLRGALTDLTAAHAALLDTFRRLAEGGQPNN